MAGDQSEYRGLIVAGTLLAVFSIITAAIPTSLYTASSMHTITPPDYFDLENIYYYTSTDLVNLTGNGVYQTVELDDGSGDFGGWDLDFTHASPNATTLFLTLWHMHTEWFGFLGADHAFTWSNMAGVGRETTITIDELETDMDNGQAEYRCECDHTRVTVILAYNDTVYSSAEEAWDMGGLSAFFGMQFDDENTGYNALNLIASILFFDMPQVHWSINMILATPLWIAIGYITYILVLRAIEALPFT